jgi:hypothetical protein
MKFAKELHGDSQIILLSLLAMLSYRLGKLDFFKSILNLFLRSNSIYLFIYLFILLSCRCSYCEAELATLSGVVSIFFFGICARHYLYYSLKEETKQHVSSIFTYDALTEFIAIISFEYLFFSFLERRNPSVKCLFSSCWECKCSFSTFSIMTGLSLA